MNPNTGEFFKEHDPTHGEQGAQLPPNFVPFKIDEEYVLNGQVFRLRKITNKDLILRAVVADKT